MSEFETQPIDMLMPGCGEYRGQPIASIPHDYLRELMDEMEQEPGLAEAIRAVIGEPEHECLACGHLFYDEERTGGDDCIWCDGSTIEGEDEDDNDDAA